MTQGSSSRLADVAPQLARILKRSMVQTPARFAVSDIRCSTVTVPMRDGVRLATDIYLPPVLPAPTAVMRTPFGRGMDIALNIFLFLVRRGYVVVVQDCRGTGSSEPDTWDYYVREPEDGYDCIQWIAQQDWCDGFIGSFGGSYLGQVQWKMAMHPRMSTIIPEVL